MILANKPLPSYPLPQPREATPPVIQRRPKTSAKPLVRWGVVMLILAVLSCGVIARQFQIVSTNRSISRLHADIAAAEATYAALQLQAAQLSSSARIETIARTKLGMARPTESQIMKVGVSGGN